jgi:hypothetical protein
MAVRAMLMLDPAVSDHYGPDYAIGRYRHLSWQANERFNDFVSGCLPKAPVESERVSEALIDKRSLKAWELESRLGITFKKTENLAQHLLLDPESRFLYLFHHAAFLRAKLARLQTQNAEEEQDLVTSLRRFFNPLLEIFNLLAPKANMSQRLPHPPATCRNSSPAKINSLPLE